MTRVTDLHGYTVPTTGDGDYDSTFDTYFTDVDSDIPIKDTDANKSNYTPKDGATFIATDTGAVYNGDGSTWTLVGRQYDSVTAQSQLTVPVYQSTTDVPTVPEGTVVFIQDDTSLYVEDGT